MDAYGQLWTNGLPAEAREVLRGPDFTKATSGNLRVNRERRLVEAAGVEPVDPPPCKSLRARDFWC